MERHAPFAAEKQPVVERWRAPGPHVSRRNPISFPFSAARTQTDPHMVSPWTEKGQPMAGGVQRMAYTRVVSMETRDPFMGASSQIFRMSTTRTNEFVGFSTWPRLHWCFLLHVRRGLASNSPHTPPLQRLTWIPKGFATWK